MQDHNALKEPLEGGATSFTLRKSDSEPVKFAEPLDLETSGNEADSMGEAQSLLRVIRLIRAEAQDLSRALVKVREGEAAPQSLANYFRKSKKDLDMLMKQLAQIEPNVPAAHCDHVRHLINMWEIVQQSCILTSEQLEQDSQKYFTTLTGLISALNAIVAECGFLTIPSRVNRWLAQAKPGHYIPFHDVFSDELPDEEERSRILNFLAWSPGLLKAGYVDTSAGLIYRYEENWFDRLKSLALVVTCFGSVTAGIIGACFLSELGLGSSWPLTTDHTGIVTLAWLALIVGIAVHAAVATVKRGNSGKRPPLIAKGDLLLFVSAQRGILNLKIFTAAIGLFGLIFVAGIASVSALNAFLVGYSLDSFVGLFGENLEKQAALQSSGFQQKLKA